MIDIIFKHRDELLVSFTIEGHAEYKEEDTVIYDDVICGVVSNLGQVTILGVTEVLGLKVPYTAEDGYIRLDISNIDKKDVEKCQVLFETMHLGLKSLELNYSEYMKVSIKEVQ